MSDTKTVPDEALVCCPTCTYCPQILPKLRAEYEAIDKMLEKVEAIQHEQVDMPDRDEPALERIERMMVMANAEMIMELVTKGYDIERAARQAFRTTVRVSILLGEEFAKRETSITDLVTHVPHSHTGENLN